MLWLAVHGREVNSGPDQSARHAGAGRYFGLLALSGKVTSFLGPLMVAVATDLTGRQAAGPAILIGFFVIGGWLLSGVGPGRK